MKYFFLLLCLSSCCTQQPIVVNDETLYFLKGSSGAVVLHFLTTGQTDITEAQWNAISEGMVCESAAAWADINTEFEKFCSEVTCDYNTTQMVRAFFLRLKIASNGKTSSK